MRGSRIAGTLLWLVLATVPARATEVPYRLADINQAPSDPSLTSLAEEPSDFFQLAGRLFFSTAGSRADEGILWSTDGTAAGTVQISSSLCPAYCRGIRPLALWHGIALLEVMTGDSGRPFLARTDGTSAGTFPLTGPDGETFLDARAVYTPAGAGVFYFEACLASRGCQLLRSDGTRADAATVLAADGLPLDNAHSFVARGDRLYFVAYHGPQSTEGVWSTGGTPGGTVLLSGIQEPYDTEARLLATPSHLFFTSGPTGEDLWATDGTPGTARRVADFAPVDCTRPPVSCQVPEVDSTIVDGDAVYFVTHRKRHGTEVWGSDGTVAGTGPLLELPAGLDLTATPHRLAGRWLLSVTAGNRPPVLWTAGERLAHAAPLTGCGGCCPDLAGFLSPPANGSQLFAGADAAHGVELWSTDGTAAGTRRLADACPGSCSGLRLTPFRLPIILPGPPGKTYFRAYPSADAADETGDELWITDGTPAGTHRAAGHVSALGLLDGRTYFGTGRLKRPASELWVTDGAPGASGRARRIAVLRKFAPDSFPRFQPFEDGALLLADAGNGDNQLWKSDGTPAGTVPLLGFAPDSGRSLGPFLTPVGALRFFPVVHQEGDGPARAEIWRTDGSVQGTRRVIELGPGQGLDTNTASWAGKLLFDVQGPAGCAFWTSDGTPSGTRQILPPLPGVPCPSAIVPFDARFLFFTQAGTGGRAVPQVFISDGTPAGTRQISDLHGTRFLFFDYQPVQAGGIVFFRINSINGDPELWRTDGTPEGTRRAYPLAGVDNLHLSGGSLYFTAFLPSGDGFGLFRVPLPDGSPMLLAALDPPGVNGEIPAQLTPVGDRLLFAARDPERGTELWATDGTPAGTHPLSDLQPGAGSSEPQGFTAAGDRVFFSADDGSHGRELWESDGTPEGTRRVADIAPGGVSALLPYPFQPVVSNGFLFFAADDGKTGVEPWALRLEP